MRQFEFKPGYYEWHLTDKATGEILHNVDDEEIDYLCFEPGGCTLTFSEVLNLCQENLISADILYSENTENNGILLNNDKRLDQIEEIPIAARLMAETLYDYYIAA